MKSIEHGIFQGALVFSGLDEGNGRTRLAGFSKDMQTPHDEDELYLVVAGWGRLRINGAEHSIVKDTLMYVRASCDHTFFDIKEDLTVLAFFGSAVNSAWLFMDSRLVRIFCANLPSQKARGASYNLLLLLRKDCLFCHRSECYGPLSPSISLESIKSLPLYHRYLPESAPYGEFFHTLFRVLIFQGFLPD